MGSHVALVKGNLHMGFQVDRVTHILWFWLKEVARWDLRIRKKGFLDEVDIEQTERQVFSLQSLLCKTSRIFAS